VNNNMEENPDVKEGEITPEAPSTENQSTEEVKEPVTEVATEETGDQTETAESNKGANARIRELNQRAKVAEEKAQSLAEKLAEITNPVGFQGPQVPQYTPQVSETGEVSVEDVLRTADARTELKIKQNDAINRINNESLNVVRKYSQLDPESADFDKELSETVTEATEAMVRANPYSASVEKFVDRLMKPYNKAVAKEVGQVTEKITKQVSEAALRPTSIQKVEKEAKDKSIAELEAELGIVYS
jgi:predicted nuclease with TOPRIM domain